MYKKCLAWSPVYIIAALLRVGSIQAAENSADVFLSGSVQSPAMTPLAGAHIQVQDSPLGVTTDLNGLFRLSVPSQDSFRIAVSYIGYHEQVILIGPYGWLDSSLNIILVSQVLQMSPVEIYGEGAFQRELQIEVSLDILRGSDLLNQPSIAGPDVFRTIQAMPGVHSTSEISNQIHIRGGTPDQNLVLINGVPVYQPFHLFGLASSVDAMGVDYIKYYSGGFSARYGDRLSGVMEIVTKPGSDSLEFRVDWNLLSIGSTASGAIHRNWRWRITGRRTWFDYPARLAGQEFPYHFYDLEGKLSWLINPRSLITLNLFQSFDRYDRSSETAEYNPLYEYHPDKSIAHADSNRAFRTNRNRIDWRNRLSSLRWHGRHSGKLTSQITLYRSTLQQSADNINAYFAHESASESTREWVHKQNDDHYLIATSRQTLATSRFFDTGINAILRWSGTGGVDISGGIGLSRRRMDYRWNSTDLEVISPYINIFMDYPPDSLDYMYTLNTRAAFVEGTFDIGRRITVRTGLRATKYSRSDSMLISPRVNLAYRLNQALEIKAGWGRFYQSLSSLTENGFYSVASLLFPSSEGEVSSAEHFIIGLRYTNQTNLIADFAAYKKVFDGLLFARPDFTFGTGGADGYGLELSGSYQPREDILLKSAYTYSVIEKSQAGEIFYPNYDQRHKINMLIQLPEIHQWRPGFSWAFNTGRPANLSQSIYYSGQSIPDPDNPNPPQPWPFVLEMPKNFLRYPTYHRLDFTLTNRKQFKWGGRTIYLQVMNLYARRNVLFYDDIVREDGERVPVYIDGQQVGTYRKDVWVAKGMNGFPLLPVFGISYDF